MLEIKRFIFGPIETNTYVVNDGEGRVLLIDPACFDAREKQQLSDYIQSIPNKSEICIAATHGHFDHLWGASWACEQFGVPVLVHEADMPLASDVQGQYDFFGIHRKAEPFPIALYEPNTSPYTIIHTPGHTKGSCCLYWPEEKVLFSGDTLFNMGYGRTDLPGGDYIQLMESVERLFALPADVKVYPGHGEFTTIGAERR